MLTMPAGWLARAFVTALLVITTIAALRPMISYRAIALGAGPVAVGVVAAAYALLSFAVAVPIGRRVDRFGEVRFLLAGTVVMTLVAGALLGIDTVPGLVAAQAVLGSGHMLCVVALQSLVASDGDQAQRDARFGAFTVVVSFGLIVGPALGGLVGGRGGAGPLQVFAVAVGIALAAVLVAASLWRWPPPRTRAAAPGAGAGARGAAIPTAIRLARLPGMPQAMLASLTVLAGIDILTAYLPAYGESHGIAVGTVGLLLSTQAASSMTARIMMLPLMRLLGRRGLLASSMLSTACALAVLPLAGARTAVLFALMAVGGVGLGLAQPITMSWVAGRAPAGARATALGVRLTANRLGQLLLPAGVGLIAGAAGISAIFVALGVMLAGSATLVLRTAFGDDAPIPRRPRADRVTDRRDPSA